MNELKKQVQEFQDRVFADRTLDSELREIISVLLKASPKHIGWIEKNFKEYIK